MDGRSAKRARLNEEGPPEEEILALVAKREQARQSRNYAESDALRDELKAMGVEVYDKEKVWKAKDGRQGVLFTAGPHECTLTDDEIQEYIKNREQARAQKDWDQADRLRDEMRNLGVELEDKSSTWRTSSGRVGTYSGGPLPSWLEAQRNGDPSSRGMSNVERLIAKREKLRASGDYEGADDIRRQLARDGVELYDQERTWRAADGRWGVIVTGGHQGKCYLKNHDINMKIADREQARADKNWDKADQIRDELRDRGVEVIDKEKTWVTTDGRQGGWGKNRGDKWQDGSGGGGGGGYGFGDSMPPMPAMFPGPMGMPMGPMGMGMAPPMAMMAAANSGGWSGTPSLCEASIVALIHGRERARELRNWKVSDQIRDDLKNLGVEVWDKEGKWRANDGRAGSITKLASPGPVAPGFHKR